MTIDRLALHQKQRTHSGVLKEQEVARIKFLLGVGKHARELAKVYGVSPWTINAIRRGDTWNWVKAEEGSAMLSDEEVTRLAKESEKRFLEMQAPKEITAEEIAASQEKLIKMLAENPVEGEASPHFSTLDKFLTDVRESREVNAKVDRYLGELKED
jgi:hypothetical protein